MTMQFRPQITVFLENAPGTMATVCKLIKDRKINIQAFTVFGTVDHGVFRLVVDEPQAVLDILSNKGFLAIESDVIEIPARNSPGVLHKVSSILARNKINVEYGYGSTVADATEEHFFIQASNNQKALRILKKEFQTKKTAKR
jgi:hypothetical protein